MNEELSLIIHGSEYARLYGEERRRREKVEADYRRLEYHYDLHRDDHQKRIDFLSKEIAHMLDHMHGEVQAQYFDDLARRMTYKPKGA